MTKVQLMTKDNAKGHRRSREIIISFFAYHIWQKSVITMQLVFACAFHWDELTDVEYNIIFSWLDPRWPWHNIQFRFSYLWVIHDIFRTALARWTQWWSSYSSILFNCKSAWNDTRREVTYLQQTAVVLSSNFVLTFPGQTVYECVGIREVNTQK